MNLRKFLTHVLNRPVFRSFYLPTIMVNTQLRNFATVSKKVGKEMGFAM